MTAAGVETINAVGVGGVAAVVVQAIGDVGAGAIGVVVDVEVAAVGTGMVGAILSSGHCRSCWSRERRRCRSGWAVLVLLKLVTWRCLSCCFAYWNCGSRRRLSSGRRRSWSGVPRRC